MVVTLTDDATSTILFVFSIVLNVLHHSYWYNDENHGSIVKTEDESKKEGENDRAVQGTSNAKTYCMKKVENEESTVSFHKKSKVSVMEPFPWEPSYDKRQKIQTPFVFDMNPTALDESLDVYREQLQFLSSMTFANGGLRRPSCPCCI